MIWEEFVWELFKCTTCLYVKELKPKQLLFPWMVFSFFFFFLSNILKSEFLEKPLILASLVPEKSKRNICESHVLQENITKQRLICFTPPTYPTPLFPPHKIHAFQHIKPAVAVIVVTQDPCYSQYTGLSSADLTNLLCPWNFWSDRMEA